MVCGALCLVESIFGVGVETEKWWRRRVEMEVVEEEEEEEDDGDWERGGG